MLVDISNEKEFKRLFDHSTLEAVRSVLAHLGKQNIGMFHTTKEEMYKAVKSATEFKPFTLIVDEFYCKGVIEYIAPEPQIVEVEKIVQVEAPAKDYSKFQKFIVRLFKL
jgi:hypothetical protein